MRGIASKFQAGVNLPIPVRMTLRSVRVKFIYICGALCIERRRELEQLLYLKFTNIFV